LSPHQPFQFMSGQGPRIGPNMFLPRIHAPIFLKPRAAKSSSIPLAPPSFPDLPPGASGNNPVAQVDTAAAEWILNALTRTRSVPVKRDGEARDADSRLFRASVSMLARDRSPLTAACHVIDRVDDH
jgi:hypothetical protein